MRLLHPDRRYPADRFSARVSARPALSAAWFPVRVCFLAGIVSALLVCLHTTPAHAQRSEDLAFTYSQERSKFVGPAKDNFFYLRGATIDYAWSFASGLGLDVGGTGLAVTNLRSSIDIHQVSLLVGPRYTYNLGRIAPTHINRKGALFVEGKIGYTFATTGQFPDSSGLINNTASALTYSAGAGVNFHVYHRFDLRLLEADYIRTQLPNGGNNQQNTLRLATGVNFHFGY